MTLKVVGCFATESAKLVVSEVYLICLGRLGLGLFADLATPLSMHTKLIYSR